MNETTLTFFGGINEIGGNKFLLQDRDTKVFLDFGLSFSKQAKYFAGYLYPRKVNGESNSVQETIQQIFRKAYRRRKKRFHFRE